MAPLTPAGFLSDTQQVSLLHALNLPTIPSPTTPRRFDCLAWCHSRTYRHSDRSRLAAPVRQGIAGVSWASPWYGRLATTTGRIEFVILRTGLSPPDALHTPSRECSSDRLRGSSRTPTGTRTLLLQVTRNRTTPVARAWGFLKRRPSGLRPLLGGGLFGWRGGRRLLPVIHRQRRRQFRGCAARRERDNEPVG